MQLQQFQVTRMANSASIRLTMEMTTHFGILNSPLECLKLSAKSFVTIDHNFEKLFSKAPWFHVSFPVARQVCFIRVRRRQDSCCSNRYKDMTVGIYKNGQLVRDWLTKTADGGPFKEWEGKDIHNFS